MTRLLFLFAVLAAATCSNQSAVPERLHDGGRPRRVLEPPPGEVRAAPPHAIHIGGVGPYLLGASLGEILKLLPTGPRVVLMEIEGVLDYSLAKAEGGALIIGVGPGRGGMGNTRQVSFVAVLDREIARTESGVGVGATSAALQTVLGAEARSGSRALDPRIRVFESLPNVRFVLDADRVVAVVVGRATHGATAARLAPLPRALEPSENHLGQGSLRCSPQGRTGKQEAVKEAVHKVAKLSGPEEGQQGRLVFGCFVGDEPGAIVQVDGRFAVVSGLGKKMRRLALLGSPGLVFAAPLDLEGDGRHEIVAVAQRERRKTRTARVEVFRVEGARISRLAAKDVYAVSETSTRWIGATLPEISFLLEIEARSDSLHVGGLFVDGSLQRPETVAVLSPVSVPVRRKRALHQEAAGAADDSEPWGTPVALPMPFQDYSAASGGRSAPQPHRPANEREESKE